MNPVLKVFHTTLDELESAGIRYMLMGGWAVQVWGRPRPTFDVDLTLSVTDQKLEEFLRELATRDFIVDDEFLEGFRDSLAGFAKVQVSLFEFPDPIRVDFFLVRTEYQKTAFDRRRRVPMFGRDVWVIAPEDLILHKLIANRHKDLAAIEEILQVQSEGSRLDVEYLRKWASHLRIRERLDEALRS